MLPAAIASQPVLKIFSALRWPSPLGNIRLFEVVRSSRAAAYFTGPEFQAASHSGYCATTGAAPP